jgi:cbb3-type cytochrome oxidase subunit 3
MARLRFESEHRTVNQRGPRNEQLGGHTRDPKASQMTTASDGKAEPTMAGPIIFNDDSFIPDRERVFLGSDGEGEEAHTITWEITNPEATSVRLIELRIDGEDDPLGTAEWRGRSIPTLEVSGEITSGAVSSTAIIIRPTGIMTEAYGRPMSLRIRWEAGLSNTGWWDSGPFGVASNSDQYTDLRNSVTPTGAIGTPYISREPVFSSSSSNTGEETTLRATDAPQTTSTIIPVSTSGDSTPPTGEPDQNEDAGDDSGLSTGAIAGIAVGAGALLIAIVSLLVWLFVMRPRRKRRLQENASSSSLDDAHGGVPALMLDKETSRRDDGPHEPYADNRAATPAAAEQQPSSANTDERSYTPYQQPGQANSAQNLTRSGAATPQGLPTSVAHLVEDGMTDDEIRRLEEEERQLDDAIERHRRR